MAKGPCTFRQRDVTAFLKAAHNAGDEVERVEIDKDGKIVAVIKRNGATPEIKRGTREWEE